MPKQLYSDRFCDRLKRYILVLLFSAILLASLVGANNYFRIRKIEILTPLNNLKIEGIENLINENILFLSETKSEKLLMLQNPVLKNLQIKKILPAKLLITVMLDEPLALLEANGGFFALAKDGKILYKQKGLELSLPVIRYYQKFNYIMMAAGDLINYKDIIITLDLLNSSRELGLRVDSIDIEGLHMIAFNLMNKRILFTTGKDSQLQKYELETIIKRFKIEGKDFKNLDVRFEKPVISY